jgi:hypothetical protein
MSDTNDKNTPMRPSIYWAQVALDEWAASIRSKTAPPIKALEESPEVLK